MENVYAAKLKGFKFEEIYGIEKPNFQESDSLDASQKKR